MRRNTTIGPALCGLLLLGAPAAQALERPAPAAAPNPAQPVQYAGSPYDGDPGFGGPGYGGPGYGGPEYGPGPGYGRRGGGREASGPHRYVAYHGFRIDLGGVAGVMDPTSTTGAVEHQIDIVDRAGLSPAMLSLFRSVPIRVSAGFAGGSHYRGGSEVVLAGAAAGDERPVLLHEYMHVLNLKRMSGGFHNATLHRFYEEAASRGLYEQGSYMMSNQAEFFAVTASCFLNGTVAREPYTRDAIRQRQPDYYAYLAHLFGQGAYAAASPPIPHAADAARPMVSLALGR